MDLEATQPCSAPCVLSQTLTPRWPHEGPRGAAVGGGALVLGPGDRAAAPLSARGRGRGHRSSIKAPWPEPRAGAPPALHPEGPSMALALWLFGLLASARLASANIFGEFPAWGHGAAGGGRPRGRNPSASQAVPRALAHPWSHLISAVSSGRFFRSSLSR